MVRATILYEREPEQERYARHVEDYAGKVQCRAFRHGRSFGAPFGEPAFAYYGEFEWETMDDFKAAARSEEFAASGRDAMDMGVPFTVTFSEIA